MESRSVKLLLILSQALFLVSSLIEPPTSWLMISLRVVLPIFVIVYLGLMLLGYFSARTR
jgi:hypothetical protein